MRKNMQNPSIVGVTLGRSSIIRPTRVIFQIAVIPSFKVKRRIRHDVIKIQSFVQVVGKSRVTFFAKVMADTTQSKIHFCQAVGSRFFLLSVNIDTTDIPVFFSYKVGTLNKHTT